MRKWLCISLMLIALNAQAQDMPSLFWLLNRSTTTSGLSDFTNGMTHRFTFINGSTNDSVGTLTGALFGRALSGGSNAPVPILTSGLSSTNDAYEFSGSNNITLSGLCIPANQTNYSISLWFNPYSFTGLQKMFDQEGGGGENELKCGINYLAAGKADFALYQFGYKTVGASNALSTNVWYHYAVTVSNTYMKIFIDGVQQGGNNTAVPITTFSTAVIGSLDPAATINQFIGKITRFRTYNTILEPSNIQTIYLFEKP